MAREMQGRVRDIELDPCQLESVSKMLNSDRKKSGLQCEYQSTLIKLMITLECTNMERQWLISNKDAAGCGTLDFVLELLLEPEPLLFTLLTNKLFRYPT